MNFLGGLLYKFRIRKVNKYTAALCEHMLYIYNYFYNVNNLENKGDLIKEAMALLETWERVSENIFKHKKSGTALEIKKDDDIEQVTRSVLLIEIPYLTRTKSQLIIRMLNQEANEQVTDYFKGNLVKGR